MIYAEIEGKRREAWPNSSATCPVCHAPVRARCGKINVWHWAHQTTTDCDPWYEGESSWHLLWKRLVAPQFCEVKIGPHRADIVGSNNLVIELQHSSISPVEIAERESFYQRMIWVFDAGPFIDNVEFRPHGSHDTFRWRHARKTHAQCQKPVYWDCGVAGIFHLKKMYPNSPVGGWGNWLTKDEFLIQFISDRLAQTA